MSKRTDRWHSPRLERPVEVARWGDVGVPVLVFPTAGGDAQEIERFHVVDACGPLLAEGRIKLYSCDSINGRALLMKEGDHRHRSWLLRQFVEFVGHELVPAIRADCGADSGTGNPGDTGNPGLEIIAAGSSIGAFNALSVLCRRPDVFSHAICMSGTYRLERFLDGPGDENFLAASPLHSLPTLDAGHLALLRTRSVILASGEGANEDIGESWHAAHLLGRAGVPNRVDPWGPQWAHDWPLWREMLPGYLGQYLDRHLEQESGKGP